MNLKWQNENMAPGQLAPRFGLRPNPKLYCLSPVKQEICSLRPSESENLDTRDYAQSVYVGKRGWAGRWALGVSR